MWLQEHDGHPKVILKCEGNIGRPFQISRIDIRQKWLLIDTPIHIAYHGPV